MNTPSVPSPGAATPSRLLFAAVMAAVLADLSLLLHPLNYLGGSSDDQRYLETALRWVADGPSAGTTHWALRHPLIVLVVGSFRTFGISIGTLLLPSQLCFDLLAALTAAMMLRHAGPRAAAIAVLLLILMPVLHEGGTDCGPETVELLFGVASAWAFYEGRASGRRGAAWTTLAGASLALALLTRETAACLLPLYAWAWWRGHAARSGIIWFALGFLPVLGIDTGWLWYETGQPLYRLHVDESHTRIFSAHLIGGVYDGRVFFNPDLASRWLPVGPVKLHWLIDPLLNFIVAPAFALVFATWGALAFAARGRGDPAGFARRLLPWLLAVAVSNYLLVTWALTLRPQPRYYLFATYAAIVATALLATAPWVRGGRALKRAVIGPAVLCGLIAILFIADRQAKARMLIAWLEAHPRAILHLPFTESQRLAFPAILAGVSDRVTSAPTPIGQYYVIDRRDPFPPGRWHRVVRLKSKRQFPYLKGSRSTAIFLRRS